MSTDLHHYRIDYTEGDAPRLHCRRCGWIDWESDALDYLDDTIALAKQHEADAHPEVLLISSR